MTLAHCSEFSPLVVLLGVIALDAGHGLVSFTMDYVFPIALLVKQIGIAAVVS